MPMMTTWNTFMNKYLFLFYFRFMMNKKNKGSTLINKTTLLMMTCQKKKKKNQLNKCQRNSK